MQLCFQGVSLCQNVKRTAMERSDASYFTFFRGETLQQPPHSVREGAHRHIVVPGVAADGAGRDETPRQPALPLIQAVGAMLFRR